MCLAIASWVCACSEDKAAETHARDAATEASDATAPATEPAPTANSAVGSGNVEAAFELPDNGSFETARALEVGADTMQRVVNVTQVDYYSFEAEAGKFYVLSTDQSSFSPDNVITVLDPEREIIAENDKGSLYPNDHVDARVILRTEHAGTHYVTVEDRVLPGADAEGHFIPPLFYRLSLREISADTTGYALETDSEAVTSLVLQQEMRTQTHYVTLVGQLSDSDKQDTFELHGMLDYALIGELLTTGVKGDGSSAQAVGVRVVANSDGHLLASCGLSSGQTNLHPPVDDADYRIEVSASDQVGSNGFYAIDLVLLRDNPHERIEAGNNSISDAEPITLSGGSTRRGLLLSRLPTKDVDHYRFEAAAGDLVAVNCEGESGGSGVRHLKAEVLGPTMQPLMAASEASPKPLLLEPFELEQSGTYYLKLSSETPAADDKAVEPWVRCAVLLGR